MAQVAPLEALSWMDAFQALQAEHQRLREEHQRLQEDHQRLLGGHQPLLDFIRSQQERLDALTQQVEALQKENEEWRKGHRVRGRKRSPKKSDKTPEGDKKKPGRKEGHQGAGRPPPERIDHTEVCRYEQCPHCQGHLVDLGVGSSHTVEELVIRVEATTYQQLDQACERCLKQWRAPLPPELGGPAKIGPDAQAIAMALRFDHGIGVCAISRLFSTIFSLPFSPGGLSQMFERNLDKFAPAITEIWTVALDEPLLHSDETGWYQGGAKAWVHAATSEKVSLFLITLHRDRASFEALVPPEYEGFRVSDDFSIYDYLNETQHVQCWAHVLRTARDLAEIHGDAADGAAHTAILDFIAAAKAQQGSPCEENRAAALSAFEAVLKACAAATHTKIQTMGQRLSKKRIRYLLCLDHPWLPLTNNQVERDIRFFVVVRKMSYGTRNETGSEQWSEGVTLSQTLRKQGQSLLVWISQALAAWSEKKPLPSVFRERAPPRSAPPVAPPSTAVAAAA